MKYQGPFGLGKRPAQPGRSFLSHPHRKAVRPPQAREGGRQPITSAGNPDSPHFPWIAAHYDTCGNQFQPLNATAINV